MTELTQSETSFLFLNQKRGFGFLIDEKFRIGKLWIWSVQSWNPTSVFRYLKSYGVLLYKDGKMIPLYICSISGSIRVGGQKYPTHPDPGLRCCSENTPETKWCSRHPNGRSWEHQLVFNKSGEEKNIISNCVRRSLGNKRKTKRQFTLVLMSPVVVDLVFWFVFFWKIFGYLYKFGGIQV